MHAWAASETAVTGFRSPGRCRQRPRWITRRHRVVHKRLSKIFRGHQRQLGDALYAATTVIRIRTPIRLTYLNTRHDESRLFLFFRLTSYCNDSTQSIESFIRLITHIKWDVYRCEQSYSPRARLALTLMWAWG